MFNLGREGEGWGSCVVLARTHEVTLCTEVVHRYACVERASVGKDSTACQHAAHLGVLRSVLRFAFGPPHSC